LQFLLAGRDASSNPISIAFNKFDSQQFVDLALLDQLVEQRPGRSEVSGIEASTSSPRQSELIPAARCRQPSQPGRPPLGRAEQLLGDVWSRSVLGAHEAKHQAPNSRRS
jgi:hypothetical protein